MAAAYIEHRPLASDPRASTAHHAVVVGGQEVKNLQNPKRSCRLGDWSGLQAGTRG